MHILNIKTTAQNCVSIAFAFAHTEQIILGYSEMAPNTG